MERVYQFIVIVSGVILLLLDLRDISMKRMDIAIGSWWAILSLIVIIFGFVFDFTSLHGVVRYRNLLLIYLFSVSLVTALYFYGRSITKLKKECAELAMWVSYAKALRERSAGPDRETAAADDAEAGIPM